MDIGAWLRELSLERYEHAFRDNAVDFGILPRLTAEDLKEIGVTTVGDRRRILDAIVRLLEGSPHPPAAREAAPTPAERRQLTVMFVDLVGSTTLAGGSTPRRCARCSARIRSGRGGRALRGPRGQVHGRRGAGVFRLAPGPRGRRRARRARRAGGGERSQPCGPG